MADMETPNRTDRPTPAAAYATFLWQLTKVRKTFTILTNEALRVRDLADVQVPAGNDLTKLVFAMLASAGRSTRNEISNSIRNNCAGAMLQIAWTLFDAHLDALGVPPQKRGTISAGPVLNGKTFAEILWAARNGFAHAPEWRSQGGPRTAAGRRSLEILRCVGFTDPARLDSFSAFELSSDGDVDTLITRLQVAAKDAVDATPTPTTEGGIGSPETILAVGLFLVLAIYAAASEFPGQDSGADGTFVFQIGRGEEAIVVPLAHGRCVSPLRFRAILEEAATSALSAEDARPFREVESRTKLWFASAEVLLATDPASARFHRDLLAMCEQMDELYAMLLALPDPVDLLLKRRQCASIEQALTIVATLLESHGGFQSIPYREFKADILSPNV